MYYGKECVEDYDYWHQPHEVEAHHMEEVLYLEYLTETQGVPQKKVAQSFSNRLLSPVY
jgi:hypothetical protein